MKKFVLLGLLVSILIAACGGTSISQANTAESDLEVIVYKTPN